MLSLALSLSLVTTAAAPLKLASPGLSFVDVDGKLAEMFSDHFAQQLVLNGVSVITRSEISQLLGMERQAQLLGCHENQGSCLAELAGGLGVDGLITGTIARLESGYLIDLKILGAKNGAPLAVASGRAKNSDALVEWLNESAAKIARQLRGEPAPEAALSAGPVEASGGLRSRAWIPLIGTAAFAAVGAGLLASAHGLDGQLRDGTASLNGKDQLNQAVASGSLQQSLGVAGLVVAGGCAVAAGAMFFFGGSGEPSVSALVTGDGAYFSAKVNLP